MLSAVAGEARWRGFIQQSGGVYVVGGRLGEGIELAEVEVITGEKRRGYFKTLRVHIAARARVQILACPVPLFASIC
jgi:hypothetical protein